MNIKDIYDQATIGSIQIDKKGNPLIAEKPQEELYKQLVAEQIRAWQDHPETKHFLSKLSQEADDHLLFASTMATTATELEIRSALVKYQTIKEILDYARRSNDSSPSKSNTSTGNLPITSIAAI